MQLDFWAEPSHLNSPVDIMVSPEQKAWLQKHADFFGLEHQVMIADVQEFSRVLLIGVLGLVLVSGEKKRYDGHQVLRFVPKTQDHLEVLRSIQSRSDQRTQKLDFWAEPSHLNSPVDIMVSPEQKAWLQKHADFFGLEHQVMIADVQELADSIKVGAPGTKLTWDAYYDSHEIYAWVDEITAQFPEIITTQSIGKSTKGRELMLMRINKPSDQQKISVFLNSTGIIAGLIIFQQDESCFFRDSMKDIHAREWITSATTTWIFNELLTNEAYAAELDKFDFHYVPVLNPDGLAYTHNGDRLWRKTLSEHNSFWRCFGVDANRNFDKSFGGPGASHDECSELYHGPSAFSEPETQAVRDYILANKDDIKIYLDVHSYSQLILLPYGDTSEKPDDYADLLEKGLIMEDALRERYETDYVTGSVPELTYYASGGSFDWVKGKAGVKYAMGIELRDLGHYGFLLPANQIIPSGKETLDGFLAIFNAIRDEILAGH
ncbi:unnamed protein product [Notodromas monacha]|uniref:Zinc carboxypeptidase A 1 n=1 Tax=Notodromas monacha TaxID=399045 RepID=A0A7R9BV25_9CRUS|nr:unnamed protein product [Notodromas monacha]CAG0922269.1 unnamed protein product [Notodromas monacha]